MPEEKLNNFWREKMSHSKIINFCYWILPFHAWKDFLLSHHIEKCPRCAKSLATREEARSVLIQVDEAQNLETLWPAIQAKLGKEKKAEGMGKRRLLKKLRWQWTIGVAVVLLAIVVNFFLFKGNKSEEVQRSGEIVKNESFQLNYVEIESEPARTFIFQPRDSKVIIVWAEKNI